MKKPIEESLVRFWKRVSKEGPIHPIYGRCWVWDNPSKTDGYGYFRFLGRSTATHRIAWTVIVGKIPDGLNVLHKCDNRACVRPTHLFLGTKKDNYRDAFAKDRHSRGERHGEAKLTDELVRQMRREYRPRVGGRYGIAYLSKKYGIHYTAVWKIVKRIHWTHI